MPNFIMEKKITDVDLVTADEVFLTGTEIEVLPVTEIDGIMIGDGSIGRFTKIIKQAYKDSVRKKINYGLPLEEI